MRKAQRWVPVSERLPEKYGRYLTLSCIGGMYVYSYISGREDIIDDPTYEGPGFYCWEPEWGFLKQNSITHWMPLPPKPEEGAP